MTGADRSSEIVDDLDAALRDPLGVRRIERVKDLFEAGTFTRYLREPRLTFALHFDIEPKFLVLDPTLGTFGIVELVMPGAAPADVEKAVRRHIDRATYLRHLLLRDTTRERRRPLNVELVLLTADPLDGEQDALAPIGTALRKVVQETDSLFQVGVNVLSHGGPASRFNGRLRRAFPWLLTAVRRWLSSSRANPEEARASTERSLRTVKLTDYRLAGIREINLSDARVHLMHGPNGSGKSSIAEALEIVTCGTVERLVKAGADRYDAVIRHAATPDDKRATVQLGWMDRRENRIVADAAYPIEAGGVKDPLDRTVNVASFRLDQPLMDRLIGHSAHDRAKLFMDAFFPKAVASRTQYEQAFNEHQAALQHVDALVERMSTARKDLAELQTHRPRVSKATDDPFPVVLNKWLEQTALMDLLQRQRIVRATIEAAHRAGWRAADAASGAVASALSAAGDITALERLEQESKASVDELAAQLDSFKARTVDTAATASPVSKSTVDALNAVCPFLFTADVIASYGRFGEKVAAVINGGDAPTYGPIVIGSEKWTEPVLKDLDRLIDVCKALRIDEADPPEWPGKAVCQEYDAARRTHADRRRAGTDLTLNFIDKLRPDEGVNGEFDGSLIAAINELMALFTPARWAYPDILLPHNLADKISMPIHLQGGKEPIRAELHLNTAELNLFTVALFVLCIGCVKKPLNLLVLDDPLQNMDELTATALARGLAKVVRLWADLGRREEILLLFHGYNDLDRFSSEMMAATYRLSWLSPTGVTTPVPATNVLDPVNAIDKGGDVLAVQKIDGMSPTEIQ